MKKYYSYASLLCALSFISSSVLAFNPIVTSVIFTCPCINTLTSVNYHIEGKGFELLVNKNYPIVFESENYLVDVPNNYFNYFNAAVSYDSMKGRVFCQYDSSNTRENSFLLSYQISNGIGGTVQSSSNSSIMIGLPLGLKA